MSFVTFLGSQSHSKFPEHLVLAILLLCALECCLSLRCVGVFVDLAIGRDSTSLHFNWLVVRIFFFYS